jgi:hypothetical protein
VITPTPTQWLISDQGLDQTNGVGRAPAWRKSSYSPNESDCVEVASL